METSNQLRHRIISSLPLSHTEKLSDALVLVWDQISTEIISIVGEGGFNSLYARSVAITHATFPWLEFDTQSPQDFRFSALKMCFESQTPDKAREANALLLITFTDIMASLIGETLTTSILRLAWGSETLERTNEESS